MHRLAAEFVGTFGLVFAGTGAVIINSITNGGVSHVGIGLTFGLIIMVMIYAFGHVSGAHFNPAVTLAFAAGRHFPWLLVPQYWAAQLAGGITASLVHRALFGDVAHLGATCHCGSASQSFGLEIVLTLLLMVVITSVATDTRAVGQAAAIAIGGTIGWKRSSLARSPGQHEPGALPRPGHRLGNLAGSVALRCRAGHGAVVGVLLYNWIRSGDLAVPGEEE